MNESDHMKLSDLMAQWYLAADAEFKASTLGHVLPVASHLNRAVGAIELAMASLCGVDSREARFWCTFLPQAFKGKSAVNGFSFIKAMVFELGCEGPVDDLLERMLKNGIIVESEDEDVYALSICVEMIHHMYNKYHGDTAADGVRSFHKLKKRVLLWAGSRGILASGTLKGQASKNLEEAAELAVACKNLDALEIVDGIGDNLVTLILTAEMARLDILDCLEHALGVIEARKGKMQNGVFVKDGE
jgi:phosphoribosyl-ATP pyrophosphohydrolase